MKRIIFWLGFAFWLAACAPRAPQTNPTLKLEDCQLASQIKAQCGWLEVPEDRAQPGGRTVRLRVAVVSAVNRNAEPDPLFFLTGGPGQAASESYPSVAGAFGPINQKRAIVLMDQRGTGQSNALRCASSGRPEDLLLDDAQIQAQSKAEVQACLRDLPGDPRLYTTTAAMQDLEDLRAALNYERINLYGVSYGTRAALTYLRLYPERVRSVILDGVVPQEAALGADIAVDAQRALDLAFDRCAADAACQAHFPELRTEFNGLLTRLEAAPPLITVTHPVSGAPTALRFTRGRLTSAIRFLSYAPETVALLPLLIHAAAQGDYGPLAAQALMFGPDLDQSISAGLSASVTCAEDIPFIDFAAAERASAGTYLGRQVLDGLRQLCAQWPQAQAPADFKQPVQSDVPVLLLSGQADPVTPPANAERAAASLPNSRQLVAEGQGHNVIIRGCLPNVAGDFIAAGSVAGLSAECVANLAPAPFFLTLSGPQP